MRKTKRKHSSRKLAASSQFEGANTDAERKVVKCFAEVEIAGREFGQAVIELRDEIKENGSRNFMARLEELGIPRGQARYWMALVEGKPIHRGKAKQAAGAQEKPTVDWREDWPAVTVRFRVLADAVIMLEQQQPEGCESFIGELKNLAEILGYELRPKRREIGLLQREQPGGGGVAA